MKLKYYLRGLGTGIVVTALILGISLSHGKGSMSDEEIKKRAAELGMVEEFKSLAEASEEKETKKTKEEESKVSGNDAADGQTPTDSKDTGKAEEESVSKTDAKENKQEEGGFGSSIEKSEDSVKDDAGALEEELQEQPEEKENDSSVETKKSILLEVRSGDGSLSVARKAANAGLVADAAEFDRFLCSGGYDRKICTGKHEIPEGATMEEIAKLLIQKP
ncbi:MAG: endolytic transglycosylase MltG [Lachnospiraceae bacterium]|nr:endolytic transglycosylase MltG [Lachnospiraceae bacterium]